MALVGINVGGGGNFIPRLNYDARAGRFIRRDRENGVNNDVDITKSFEAVIDLENIETGWIHFPMGGVPSFALVPNGTPLPPQPSKEHKAGFRVRLKLGKNCGGDIRELSSTSRATIAALDALHTAYEKAKAENPGKLPVITAGDPLKVTSTGPHKATNYQPTFLAGRWVDRPADLVAPDAAPAPAAASGPPTTGSRVVSAPGGDDDFG